MPTPRRFLHSSRSLAAAAALALIAACTGCHHNSFPDVPAGYHEFAYVSNGGSNTVTVLDLVYLRQDRTLRVGDNPTGLAVNPVRNEVYVVNTKSDSISVIDAESNRVVATIPVHRSPYFISVDDTGHRAYVANSGSNIVSVIDLDQRREIALAGTGEQPGLARISPDNRTLVVTNRGSGSISIYDVAPYERSPADRTHILHFRDAFSGCPGATDAVILPDSSKVFVACSSGHQVMAVNLAADPHSWNAKQNPSLLTDRLLTLLDVGNTPVNLALKPDGGEIFVSNFNSDSISEIDTWNNQVGWTQAIGNKPTHGIVSRDNSSLWVSNFGADSLSLYSIDDGRVVSSVHTGSEPDALAFSADEHLLLAADAHSGDVSVIRTQDKTGPTLFTILPAGSSPNAIVTKAFKLKS
ncbi:MULTISPECIES: YncE family protein [Acidobacteriaceae]|uniref:YncE family protein n=1 Tax=Acidobacteriaceae TaxID=204434 RepID=UPI0020B11B4A|nr:MULTISPECIES: YncE family protein [Acidobacteriaceae]MDW5264486.1 YncE family protein [Edaphobacter sp.]